MIVQESFLKKLRSAFDLNIYEVKIWTALLSRGVATAGELSDISNVPRSRSYDVLESLEKKGFVIMKIGKPIKYLAVKPEDILKRVKKNVQEKADQQISFLNNVKEDKLFKDLELLHKQGIVHIDPNSLSGSLKGRSNIYDHLKSMLDNAQKSVIMVTTTKGLQRKLNIFRRTFNKLTTNGVSVRIVAPLTPEIIKYLKTFKGMQFKNINKINARFVIIDNKDIMFMISDDNIHESYDTGIWVNTPFFSSALANMFDQSWKSLNIKK